MVATPQQEPLPFAPLVERCFELAVDISAEQFEEEAGAFMAAVGKELDLSVHKTIEHWEIRIDKPKGMPPKPKATLYPVPTISRPETSVRTDCSVETLHLTPATASEPARLKYSQLRPLEQTGGCVMSFEMAKSRLGIILNIWQEKFGNDAVLQTTLHYWNDLYNLADPYFHQGSVFHLSRSLRYFKENEKMGILLPPWNVVMNWAVPSRPEAVLHLDIKGEWIKQSHVWTVLAYFGKMSDKSISLTDCLAELDTAHTSIYEKFLSILTPEALEYCKNGSVNDPTSKH